MKTKEVVKRAKRFAEPYRIKDGSDFQLASIDPADTLDLKADDRPRAREALAIGVEELAAVQDMLCGQGRRDQARHVGRQSAGLSGLFLQSPFVGRTRPRLPLALREVPARTRAH